MFTKIVRRVREVTSSEKASLPAVMITAMLLAAVTMMLASFSIVNVKNTEVLIAKSNLNKAITSCSTSLNNVVLRSFHADPIPNLNTPDLVQRCQFPELNVNVTLTTTGAKAPAKHTNPGDPNPTSLKVYLTAVHTGVNTTTVEKARYLTYAEEVDVEINEGSYISGWDVNGNAIWFTPEG